jgi:hypothetical protein
MEISPVNEWTEFYLNEMRYALLNFYGGRFGHKHHNQFRQTAGLPRFARNDTSLSLQGTEQTHSSLRGAQRRGNPATERPHALDCHASLAMTNEGLGMPRQGIFNPSLFRAWR